MPGIEKALPRFRAANTQVLGISIDSIYCHANWGKDLGGVSFPLLSDFHPKGQVAKSFGLYLEEMGITDRATVFIDSTGKVREVNSVTPSGERQIDHLVAACEKMDRELKGKTAPFPEPKGLTGGARLFVKSQCGFSRSVLLALSNLHLESTCQVLNITESAEARGELQKLVGKEQVPCLMAASKTMHESKDIVTYLVDQVAPV